MVMKERDEELTLFLEMRRREKEKNSLLLVHNSNDDLDASLVSNVGGGSPISKLVSSGPAATRKATATENFLNSENDKSDYDWLLTPPGTPLFPSLEMESQKAKVSQIGMSNAARPTALKPRLENLLEEPTSKSNIPPKNPTLSSGLNTSSVGNRRPLSSTRAATPTGRPTLTTTAKPSTSRPSTPTSRATLPSSKPTVPAARSSTSTASAVRSSTPAASAVRSSTPTRSTARSLTPTARPTITAPKPAPRSATPNARPTITAPKPVPRSATPASRSTSRSATPTRRASAPSSAPSVSAPPSRSSSVSKSGSATLKNPAPSRGSSPTVKSRPWKPSEMPGFSLDAPPNLRTSLPERPASASRGRPGATSTQSSIDVGSNGRRRQQSCSPSKVRTSNGSARGNGSFIPSARKVNTSCSDDVSPVQMGTQMVERVVNMRKLAPPKQDHRLAHNNSAGKSSSSNDSSGFGRTLSKKSLDMALRHMDIRRSITGNLRPLMTNIPASSMYSVRSGSTKTQTLSVSDSPLATSSNASSEPSVNNSFCLDEIEIEDNHDLVSERGNTSPSSQRGR